MFFVQRGLWRTLQQECTRAVLSASPEHVSILTLDFSVEISRDASFYRNSEHIQSDCRQPETSLHNLSLILQDLFMRLNGIVELHQAQIIEPYICTCVGTRSLTSNLRNSCFFPKRINSIDRSIQEDNMGRRGITDYGYSRSMTLESP